MSVNLFSGLLQLAVRLLHRLLWSTLGFGASGADRHRRLWTGALEDGDAKGIAAGMSTGKCSEFICRGTKLVIVLHTASLCNAQQSLNQHRHAAARLLQSLGISSRV